VSAATAAYMQEHDAIAAWIEEMCERDANAWERSAALFGSWKAWAERSGEPVGDTKRFRDRLESRGVHHRREPGTGRTGYQGLRLQIETEGAAWWK
jgi:putative DNA primase/helicase